MTINRSFSEVMALPATDLELWAISFSMDDKPVEPSKTVTVDEPFIQTNNQTVMESKRKFNAMFKRRMQR